MYQPGAQPPKQRVMCCQATWYFCIRKSDITSFACSDIIWTPRTAVHITGVADITHAVYITNPSRVHITEKACLSKQTGFFLAAELGRWTGFKPTSTKKNQNSTTRVLFWFLAAELGLEPRQTESESVVLPITQFRNIRLLRRYPVIHYYTQHGQKVNEILKTHGKRAVKLHFTSPW